VRFRPLVLPLAIALATAACRSDRAAPPDAAAPAEVVAASFDGAPSDVPAVLTAVLDASMGDATSRPRDAAPSVPPPSLAPLGGIALVPPPDATDGAPSIAIGRVETEGGLLREVDPSVRRMRAGLLACFTRGLGEEGAEPGHVTLVATVGSGGSVHTVAASEVRGLSPGIVDCMRRRAQVATFPAPVGGAVRVSIPVDARGEKASADR
jgi:hypothetical protein